MKKKNNQHKIFKKGRKDLSKRKRQMALKPKDVDENNLFASLVQFGLITQCTNCLLTHTTYNVP